MQTQAGLSLISELFPVYFPLEVQLKLLVNVQTVLERASFKFAGKWLPEVLEEEQWACADSTELYIWMKLFKDHRRLSKLRGAKIPKPPRELCDSLAQLRHTAVHRPRVSAREIEQFLHDSKSLATFLKDTASLKLLMRLQRETAAAIENLERNKHDLQAELQTMVRCVDAERSELGPLQKEAVQALQDEYDNRYQATYGFDLKRTVIKFEHRVRERFHDAGRADFHGADSYQ